MLGKSILRAQRPARKLIFGEHSEVEIRFCGSMRMKRFCFDFTALQYGCTTAMIVSIFFDALLLSPASSTTWVAASLIPTALLIAP